MASAVSSTHCWQVHRDTSHISVCVCVCVCVYVCTCVCMCVRVCNMYIWVFVCMHTGWHAPVLAPTHATFWLGGLTAILLLTPTHTAASLDTSCHLVQLMPRGCLALLQWSWICRCQRRRPGERLPLRSSIRLQPLMHVGRHCCMYPYERESRQSQSKPSRRYQILFPPRASTVSFDFNVSYSSCWGYSLINTLKLKKKKYV